MTPKKRLGRGLDALLSKPVAQTAAVSGGARQEGDGLRKIPVDLLQRGQYQPRVDMRQDTLEELASSIKVQGVVQPIVARPISSKGGEQRYEIVVGERRWRAAQLAGLSEIPAVVREIPDESAIAMALIENIQRENLNPIEEATALRRLVDEFQMTHEEAGKAVGRSRSAVSNLLRLLELSKDVRELVDARHMEMGHARALLTLEPALQGKAAREVISKSLSVRETEQLVRRMKNPPKRKTQVLDPDVQRLQSNLSDKLCAKVKLAHNARGKGKMVISYNSTDELQGILEHLGVELD